MAATDERRRGPDLRIAQCSPKLGRFRAAAKVRSRRAERNLWQGRRGCDVEDRSRQHSALMDRNRGIPVGLELHSGEIGVLCTKKKIWWRRRELNPGPKMLPAKRLHT